MKENEKYKIKEDDSIPDVSSSFNLRGIKDISAVVDRIEMKNRTRRRVNDNGSSKRGLPYVYVYFDAGYTELEKRYCVDPFVESRGVVDISKPMFGSLLSTADVRWNRLPELIGYEVQLESDSGSNEFGLQNRREAIDYSILMETEASSLYHNKIDDIIPDVLTRQVTNMKVGRGNIVDVSANKYKSTVSIELDSGHTFSRSFKLRKRGKEREDSKMVFGVKKSTLFLRRSQRGENYTFWDFTKDALGYIPDKENYEALLGVDVPVEYVSGEWFVKYELERSSDRVKY